MNNYSNKNTSSHHQRNLVLVATATLLLSQGLASAFTTTDIISHPVRRAGSSSSSFISLQSQKQQKQQPPFRKDQQPPRTAVHRESYRGRGGSYGSNRPESWWSPSEEQSSRFQVRRKVSSAFRRVRGKTSLYQSSDDRDGGGTQTWSRPAETSSKLGVRKRVKAVLKKAKSRTGVGNLSEDTTAAGGLWTIAEAASIGGLAEQSDLVILKTNGIKKNGSSRNGSSNGAATKLAGANGASSSSSTSAMPAPVVLDFDVEREENKDSSSSFSKDTVKQGRNSSEFDGIKADVPTALPEPLPFTLPELSEEQKKLLLAGERVQEQSKMGREGSGFVVMDVKAPAYLIWECLLDFEAYPDLIKTVRDMEMFTSNKLKAGYHAERPMPKGSGRETRHYGIPSVTRAAFILSKFRLNIAAIHNYRPHPDGHYMVFNLDPECTNVVLQSATGIWHTQSNPDGRGEEYTRVWLLCELKVSSILPKFIVDYTAKRAMPRATNWLKPHVEPLAEEWAKDHS